MRPTPQKEIQNTMCLNRNKKDALKIRRGWEGGNV